MLSNYATHIRQIRIKCVAKEKKWKPPTSRYPELELFLANVRRDLINPENIKQPRDNLSRKVVIRIQDKGSRFVLIDDREYEEKMQQSAALQIFAIRSYLEAFSVSK